MRSASGVAYARAGLLGNPSDGYHGKALALSLPQWSARATVTSSDGFCVTFGDHEVTAPSLYDLPLPRVPVESGCDLVLAGIHQAIQTVLRPVESIPRDRLAAHMEIGTSIPREVGLAGSSAIIIASVRALLEWTGQGIPPEDLAELALAAEVEHLQIAAGAMDRVIQSYGGLMEMDLRPPRTASSYRSLDPNSLPALFVAWTPGGGTPSGVAHGELRRRWESGDAEVARAIEEFRDLVDAGVDALRRGDHPTFRHLMNRNFDLRCAIFPVGAVDRHMVAIGRHHGAAVKQCGSGGAVVGCPGPDTDLPTLADAYRTAGFAMIPIDRPGGS